MADSFNAPKFRKKMVVCTPFGEFVNGSYEGDMTPELLQTLAANARKYPRQIKAYLNGDHPMSRDERPADGWFATSSVEYTTNYPGYPGGALLAEVEAHGELAHWLTNDMVRGASICIVNGKNPDGTPQGLVLDHVLISDEGFDKNVNIAATRVPGGEPVVAYFTTALPIKESAMPDPKKKEEPDQASRDRVDPTNDEPTVAAMKAKDEEIITLKARLLTADESISELKEKLDDRPVDIEKEEQAVRLKTAEFKLDALEVRELVSKGLHTGTLKPSWCAGFSDGGYSGTMTWFKASRFGGDKKLLAWAVENNPPMFKIGQTFRSGAPADDGEKSIDSDTRTQLRKHGIDPEKVLVGMKARDFDEYKSLTSKES